MRISVIIFNRISTFMLEGILIFLTLVGCSNEDSQANLNFDNIFGATAREQAEYRIRLGEAISYELINCMQQKGFMISSQNQATKSKELLEQMGKQVNERAFIDEFGYGITDIFAASLQDISNDPLAQARARQIDVASQVAFERALNGHIEDIGCLRKAEAEALGGALKLELLQIDLEESIEEDIEFLKMERQLITCMVQHGINSTYFNWGRDQIISRVTRLQSQAILTLRDGTKIPIHHAEPGTIPLHIEIPEDDLNKVREYELQIAKIEFECRASFEDQYRRLRSAYEKGFLSENIKLAETVITAIETHELRHTQ